MRTLLPALLLAMAACGKSDELSKQTTVQIEKANALRFQVVDHDSDFMRRVFVHAGGDPAAVAHGVTPQQDVWKNESTPERLQHDYFLEAKGRAQLERYFASLGPDFRVPIGHQLGFEQTEPGTWRSYYLHSPIALDGAAVESASVGHRDRPIVHLDLDDAGARTFGELTRRIEGGKLAILAGDEIVSAPIVNGAITGGQVEISFNEHAEDSAKQLASALDPD